MIDGLKPYPAYKDSGVPWLGPVPEHWEVRQIKRVARLSPSKSEAAAAMAANEQVTFLPMERVSVEGQFDPREARCIRDVWSGFTYFRRGDVIIAKITPCFENGKAACLDRLPTEFGFGSTEFIVLRPRPFLSGRYLYRMLTLDEFRRLGADSMSGAAGQQRVPSEFMSNFLISVPPIVDQSSIVTFLDHMDRRIGRYIRAKKKLIALLNEQKRAIIHAP